VRIFKNRWFSRFAKKESISDDELKAIVDELEKGQFDADLGSGVYKQRVARPGEGKSGGYRIVVFFKSGLRTFFMFGFAKSVQGNINIRQRNRFKQTAKNLFLFTDEQLTALVKSGEFIEIGGTEDGKDLQG
jgi:hypothetical protein